jgi:ribosomal-protein-alanine N-acetyltransferase
MKRAFNFPSSFPRLETKRLNLVEMKMEDANALFKMRSNPEFTKFLSADPYQEIEEAEKVIQKNLDAFQQKEAISWKIALKGKEDLIGYIGFWRLDKANFRGEVGFGLAKEERQKGLMTEALKEILNYGFKQLNFHTVMADTDPLNKASNTLLEKIGFKREAHIRENYYYNGKFVDSYYFGLLNSDF